MKRYTYKLGIAFILSYILLMLVVVFAYTQISQNFILNQAEEHLIKSGETVTKQIELQLLYDYEKFESEINTFVQNDEDPIEGLKNLEAQLSILNESYVYYGIIDIDLKSVLINDQTYIFSDSYSTTDFDQKISFYRFDQAFLNAQEDTMYGIFKVDTYVAYFELEPYIAHFMAAEKIENEYVMMGDENSIYVSSNLDSSQNLFYNFIRQSGYNEDYIDEIIDVVSNHQTDVFNMNFLNQESVVSFIPITTSLSTKGYYLVQIYAEAAVVDSLNYLTSTLWALFAVIFVLFSITLIVIYKILEQKVHDIENARLNLYYTKPYVMKIKKSGKIRSYNRAFARLLQGSKKYTYLRDFEIKDMLEDTTVEEMLHRQKSFTLVLEISDKIVYVRFITTRSTGGYILIGDDITHIEGRFDAYEKLALHNPVTDLPNQNVLLSDLDEIFSDQEKLAEYNVIAMFDIVSFSKINLVLGENSGDRFLKFIAELAKESLEGYPAKLYNLKADQFVVLLTGLDSFSWMQTWIDLFLQKLDKPITMDRNFLNVDVKIGIFNIEHQRYEILTPEICIENAKLALNHAKESSTHPSFTYDVSLSLVASREQRMEIDLANAITNQEFQMALQAQYSNVEEKIIGFEALIRWTNPKYSSESPLKFIKMA
ncbi:MAG: diguanylate cyclase, partial [Acholeplasmataceae bacterium]